MKIASVMVLLMNFTCLHGQYVPPMFKIHHSEKFDCTGRESIKDCYSFRTEYFNDRGIHSPSIDHYIYKMYKSYVYVNSGNFNPGAGDVFHLMIINKKSTEVMGIYIRTSYSLAEGEIIKVDNLQFIEGNYWFEMCNNDSHYFIDTNKYSISTPSTEFEFGFEFEFLTKHRISEYELKKLIESNDCEVEKR